ncbi:MAG: D-alanyl-D-alanine carboxypeptidase, partial [Clostridia bacterium]|nr:D-alanyl-D-alanine carboxypeptidase [Clostridia bacterium]
MKKIIILLFSAIFLISVCVVPASAYKPDFEITAEGALLVNTDTDIVIYSKNADKRLFPASLTKLMTAVIIMENTPDLDAEVITVSKEAVNSVLGTGLVVAHLQPGEKISARQMLYIILISSAADACEAVARHYAASEDDFVELMNAKAAQLGMAGTHFENTHGLHHDNHYSTVNDMYTLAKYALSFPEIKEITSLARYTVPATNMYGTRLLSTTNFLIDPSYPSYFYKYASGVKTGFTDQAGRCLISTAFKNGYNYLCIVMNCPNKDANGNKIRNDFKETRALFEWAFSTFEYKSVTTAGKPVGEVKVELSSETDYVGVMPKEEFMYMLPKASDASTITVEVQLTADVVDAPVSKGQPMGFATYYYAGEKLGTVEVVAAQDVKKDGMLAFGRMVENVVSSWYFIGVLIAIGVVILAFIVSVI